MLHCQHTSRDIRVYVVAQSKFVKVKDLLRMQRAEYEKVPKWLTMHQKIPKTYLETISTHAKVGLVESEVVGKIVILAHPPGPPPKMKLINFAMAGTQLRITVQYDDYTYETDVAIRKPRVECTRGLTTIGETWECMRRLTVLLCCPSCIYWYLRYIMS